MIPSVNLRTLMVALPDCLTVPLEGLSEGVVGSLEQHRFDDAPVIHRAEVVGIASTRELRRRLSEGRPLTPDGYRPLGQDSVILVDESDTVQADLLLNQLAANHSMLVARGTSLEHQLVVGFVTASDLNRHAMRSCLYDALAMLESGLARLVERHYRDPWDWVRFLNEEAQVRVLGYWELTRRQELDVGPIAATTLTHLLHVLASDKSLLTSVGFSSKAQFENAAGRIPRLRNSVMHPVRPLVLRPADAASVLTTLQGTLELTRRVLAVLDGSNPPVA
jgi:CBS domain-containing protein